MSVKKLIDASKGVKEQLDNDRNKSKRKNSDNNLIHEAPKNTVPNKSSSEKRGGRPTNLEKGITSRKQYTLTLKEDTYKLILDQARKEDLSFAKYMERAALEYIDRHR